MAARLISGYGESVRFVSMTLVDCVDLDAWTVMMTVRETWEQKRLWWVAESSLTKTYVLALRVERWLDGDRYVLLPDPRHFRLCELWAAWREEQKLGLAVGLPSSAPLLEG